MTDAELLEHDPVAAYLAQWLVMRSEPVDTGWEEQSLERLTVIAIRLSEDQVIELVDRRRRLYEHEGART